MILISFTEADEFIIIPTSYLIHSSIHSFHRLSPVVKQCSLIDISFEIAEPHADQSDTYSPGVGFLEKFIKEIHRRMPAILTRDQVEAFFTNSAEKKS